MKITTLSVLLSVLSLASVGVLYVKVDELSDDLKLARSSRAEVSRRTFEQERDTSYRDNSYRAKDRDGRAASDARRVDATDTDRGGVEDSEPATVEERLARLERGVKRGRGLPPPIWGGRRFVRDLDDLSDHLKLTRSQRDRVAESIRRGKDRIDAVMSVPAADGKSPKEAREERMKKMREALADPQKNQGQIIRYAMGGRQKLNEKVPGSNETYATQIKRIQQETREEVNSGLSQEQQKEFEQTNIDGILGGGSGGATMSIVSTTSFGDEDGTGVKPAVFIESAGEVDVQVEEEDG